MVVCQPNPYLEQPTKRKETAMTLKKVIVITHPLITFPNFFMLPYLFSGESRLSLVDMRMAVSWKKKIYSSLCSPRKIFLLVPHTNRCVYVGWELIKNCLDYKYNAYLWFEDEAAANLSADILGEGAPISIALVPVVVFNETCSRLHADLFGESRQFEHTNEDLNHGAICVFDGERRDAHVLLLD